MGSLAIEAAALTKRYGSTQALANVDLAADAGTVLGVLGPNGAGKTTALRILTTLALPDSGWARVAGHDVVHQAGQVRRCIGVTAQDATTDDALTGRQNLVLVGELSGLRRRSAKARAAELLDRFELTEAADRVVKGYSGGMRRRLDLAAGLVTRPPVLFLDEPTTGLDPTSRQRMWDVIRELVSEGTSVLLTTQYLDEADELAHRIAVIDNGTVIADGTPAELKRATGGTRLHVTLSAAHDAAAAALAGFVDGDLRVSEGGRRYEGAVRLVPGLATFVVRALDDAGITVDDVEVRPPSLDDVFFTLTGHPSESVVEPDPRPDLDDRSPRGRGLTPAVRAGR